MFQTNSGNSSVFFVHRYGLTTLATHAHTLATQAHSQATYVCVQGDADTSRFPGNTVYAHLCSAQKNSPEYLRVGEGMSFCNGNVTIM